MLFGVGALRESLCRFRIAHACLALGRDRGRQAGISNRRFFVCLVCFVYLVFLVNQKDQRNKRNQTI
jgi:hypothetical protein